MAPYTAIKHLHYSLDVTAAALLELEEADRLRSAWAWCVLEELPPNAWAVPRRNDVGTSPLLGASGLEDK